MVRNKLSLKEEEKIQRKKFKTILRLSKKRYDPLYRRLENSFKFKEMRYNEFANKFSKLNYRVEMDLQNRLKKADIIFYSGTTMEAGQLPQYKNKRVLHSPSFPPKRVYGVHEADNIELEVQNLKPDPIESEWEEKTCPQCEHKFRTFNKRKKYCCSLCEYTAYQKRYIEKCRGSKLKQQPHNNTCEFCGKTFESKRSKAKTCSNACRMALSRKNKK